MLEGCQPLSAGKKNPPGTSYNIGCRPHKQLELANYSNPGPREGERGKRSFSTVHFCIRSPLLRGRGIDKKSLTSGASGNLPDTRSMQSKYVPIMRCPMLFLPPPRPLPPFVSPQRTPCYQSPCSRFPFSLTALRINGLLCCKIPLQQRQHNNVLDSSRRLYTPGHARASKPMNTTVPTKRPATR